MNRIKRLKKAGAIEKSFPIGMRDIPSWLSENGVFYELVDGCRTAHDFRAFYMPCFEYKICNKYPIKSNEELGDNHG